MNFQRFRLLLFLRYKFWQIILSIVSVFAVVAYLAVTLKAGMDRDGEFFLNVMMASGRALWMFSLAALYALEQQPRRKKGEKNLSTTEKKRVQCILSVVNQMVTLNSPGLHRAAVYTRCYSIYSIFFSCFVSDHDASLSIRPIHRGASCSLALPFPLWVAS